MKPLSGTIRMTAIEQFLSKLQSYLFYFSVLFDIATE